MFAHFVPVFQIYPQIFVYDLDFEYWLKPSKKDNEMKKQIDLIHNDIIIPSKGKIHPFVAEKIISQAQNFDIEDIEKIYRNLVNLDLQIKSGNGSPKMLIRMFILSFSSPSPSPSSAPYYPHSFG